MSQYKLKIMNNKSLVFAAILFLPVVYYFINFQNLIQPISYNWWAGIITLLSIMLFMFTVILILFLIVKHKTSLRKCFYKYPQRIIEYSFENNSTSYFLFFIFSFINTEIITLLIYIIPTNSVLSIFPLENVSAALENTVQIVSNVLKSILMPYGIGINYGPDYNRNVIILFSMLSTGPALMFLLKELRKRQNSESYVNSKIDIKKFLRKLPRTFLDFLKESPREYGNIMKGMPLSAYKSWKDMKQFVKIIDKDNKEKYPGSKSLLIFLYVAILIVIQQVVTSFANWGNTLGWITAFSLLTSIAIIFMMFFEYGVTKIHGTMIDSEPI